MRWGVFRDMRIDIDSILPVEVAGSVLFSKSTKFNDLFEDVKRKFEVLE